MSTQREYPHCGVGLTEEEFEEEFIDDISIKAEFKEEDHSRDKSGKFSKKQESKALVKYKDQSRLEKYLPEKDFSMDWIEPRISGRIKLNITLDNMEKTVEEFGKLSFAIFALNLEVKDKENNSFRERRFIAQKIKKFFNLRENMKPQMESVIDEMNKISTKASSIDYEKLISKFDGIFKKSGIDQNYVDNLMKEFETTTKSSLNYVGGALFCDKHLEKIQNNSDKQNQRLRYSDEMDTCNYPKCTIKFDKEVSLKARKKSTPETRKQNYAFKMSAQDNTIFRKKHKRWMNKEEWAGSIAKYEGQYVDGETKFKKRTDDGEKRIQEVEEKKVSKENELNKKAIDSVYYDLEEDTDTLEAVFHLVSKETQKKSPDSFSEKWFIENMTAKDRNNISEAIKHNQLELIEDWYNNYDNFDNIKDQLNKDILGKETIEELKNQMTELVKGENLGKNEYKKFMDFFEEKEKIQESAYDDPTQIRGRPKLNKSKKTPKIKFKMPRFRDFHSVVLENLVDDKEEWALKLQDEMQESKTHYTKDTLNHLLSEAEYQIGWAQERIEDNDDVDIKKDLRNDKKAWTNLAQKLNVALGNISKASANKEKQEKAKKAKIKKEFKKVKTDTWNLARKYGKFKTDFKYEWSKNPNGGGIIKIFNETNNNNFFEKMKKDLDSNNIKYSYENNSIIIDDYQMKNVSTKIEKNQESAYDDPTQTRGRPRLNKKEEPKKKSNLKEIKNLLNDQKSLMQKGLELDKKIRKTTSNYDKNRLKREKQQIDEKVQNIKNNISQQSQIKQTKYKNFKANFKNIGHLEIIKDEINTILKYIDDNNIKIPSNITFNASPANNKRVFGTNKNRGFITMYIGTLRHFNKTEKSFKMDLLDTFTHELAHSIELSADKKRNDDIHKNHSKKWDEQFQNLLKTIGYEIRLKKNYNDNIERGIKKS